MSNQFDYAWALTKLTEGVGKQHLTEDIMDLPQKECDLIWDAIVKARSVVEQAGLTQEEEQEATARHESMQVEEVVTRLETLSQTLAFQDRPQAAALVKRASILLLTSFALTNVKFY